VTLKTDLAALIGQPALSRGKPTRERFIRILAKNATFTHQL